MRWIVLGALVACGHHGFARVSDGGGASGDGLAGDGDSSMLAASSYIKAPNVERDDLFGEAIALSTDGTTLAVGAKGEDSGSTDQTDNSEPSAGAVYVYVRSGSTWTLQAYLKASNADPADAFGAAVALSADGSTLAVGAPLEDSVAVGINGNELDNSEPESGAVYVFRRTAAWTQQAYVKASNAGGMDRFGSAVALSADGNTLAVGATGEASSATFVDGNQGSNNAITAGAAYVFRYTSSWTQEAYVKASNTGQGDFFGAHVALSADGATLAVTAPLEDGAAAGTNPTPDENATDAGAAYVYRRQPNWQLQAYIKASNTNADDDFGEALALSGDATTLVVGAKDEASNAIGIDGNAGDNSAFGAGAAYVFIWSGVQWTLQAYMKASNTGADDWFGSSLALSSDGSTLLVGAPFEDSGATGVDGDQADSSATSSGAAYVFTRAGGTWAQQQYRKASNTGTQDWFGWSCALSGDGSVLAVGAPHEASAVPSDETDNSASNAGAVYVYQR